MRFILLVLLVYGLFAGGLVHAQSDDSLLLKMPPDPPALPGMPPPASSSTPGSLQFDTSLEKGFKNTDWGAPWNSLLYKDDIFAPWNMSTYKDDIAAPWNNPMAGKEETNRYLKNQGGVSAKYYWK